MDEELCDQGFCGVWKGIREQHSIGLKSPKGCLPSTASAMELAEKRVDLIRTQYCGETDLEVPPRRGFFILFVITLATRILPDKGHKTPNRDSILSQFRYAYRYCKKRYSSDSRPYTLSGQERNDIMRALKELSNIGLVVEGWSNPLQRIDTVTVVHISKEIFISAEMGRWSWNVSIYSSLLLNLYRVLSVQSGDLAVSKDYKGSLPLNGKDNGYFFPWKDFKIRVECGQDEKPLPKHLKGVLILRFHAHHKDDENEDTRFIDSIDGNGVTCVLLLALIHAARQGLIEGDPETPEEILENAKNNPEGLVAWKHPNYPVLCSRIGSEKPRLLLHRPASTEEILRTVKECAELARIKGEVTIRGLRAGQARDAGMIRRSQLNGKNVSLKVGQGFLAHAERTVAAGRTRDYAGPVKVDFNGETMRAARYSAFSTIPVAKVSRDEYAAVTPNEIEEDILANSGDPKDTNTWNRTRRKLTKARNKEYFKHAPSVIPTSVDPQTGGIRQPLGGADFLDANSDSNAIETNRWSFLGDEPNTSTGNIGNPICEGDNAGDNMDVDSSDHGQDERESVKITNEANTELERTNLIFGTTDDQKVISQMNHEYQKFVSRTSSGNTIKFMQRYMKIKDARKGEEVGEIHKTFKEDVSMGISEREASNHTENAPTNNFFASPFRCSLDGCIREFKSKKALNAHVRMAKLHNATARRKH